MTLTLVLILAQSDDETECRGNAFAAFETEPDRKIVGPDSIQFYLAQPASMPDETTYREALQDEKSPLTRAVPGYEAEEAIMACGRGMSSPSRKTTR